MTKRADRTDPREDFEVADFVDDEELDSIAGGDGGQPSYPPYL